MTAIDTCSTHITVRIRLVRRRWTLPAMWLLTRLAVLVGRFGGHDRAMAFAMPCLAFIGKHGYRPVICG
jgi:hypothetical protein